MQVYYQVSHHDGVNNGWSWVSAEDKLKTTWWVTGQWVITMTCTVQYVIIIIITTELLN